MIEKNRSAEKKLFQGVLLRFGAEALILPTGLLTAALLSRQFGPAGYGLLTLTIVIISWIEWSILSSFARGTIRYVSRNTDWEPAAGKILQWHLAAGILATGIIFFAAPAIASSLRQPEIAPLLRLMALDIPFFCLTGGHYNILVGRGEYRKCAAVSSVRSLGRLGFIFAFVLAGLAKQGVLFGLIGNSILTLLICRGFMHPPFLRRIRAPMPEFWATAGWLFLYAVCLRLFERLDLIALNIFVGSAEQAGYYGAAQNLCHILNLLALSASPLFLSTLTKAFKDQDFQLIRSISVKGLKAAAFLFPLVCLAATFSEKIILLIYGPAFLPAAGVLSILIFGSFAMLLLALATAALTAAGQAKLTFLIAVSLVPTLLVCLALFIPRWGMAGAALGSTLVTALGAAAAAGYAFRAIRATPALSVLEEAALKEPGA